MSLLETQRSSWSNHYHSKTLCENLHNMFLEQAMCDVAITFKTKNQQQTATKPTIGAHRVVLSAMSPVFKERILMSPGGGHTLELEHDPRIIQKLLNYIYTGNLLDDCAEVTRCASELEICGIEQLCKFETEVHSQPIRSGGRIYNPTLTLKSELSDDEELDLFEDSDEWDPILAPELILHVGNDNEPPSSLASSSSGEDDYCDPMKFDISMPGDLIDDASDAKVDSVLPEGRSSERTKRGRPKGSSASAKRIKVLSPGLALPQVINKLGGSGNNKKYLCSLCGRTLTGLTAYNRHQVVHTGARPYECDTCEKTFTQAQRLKIHVRKHTGERPYLCSLCGKTFTESCKLKRHLASVHKANRDGNELIPGQPVVNARIPPAAAAGKMAKEAATTVAVGGKRKQAKAPGKAKVNTSHAKVKSS